MTNLRLFILNLLIVIGSAANAQNSFVQFIVIGLENQDQCRMLADSVRTHPGFGSVRAEPQTGNFFAILNQGYSYSEDDFRNWIQALGFDLYCYRVGILGIDIPSRIKRTECEALELKQQE